MAFSTSPRFRVRAAPRNDPASIASCTVMHEGSGSYVTRTAPAPNRAASGVSPSTHTRACPKHIASLANLEVLALGETTIGNAGWRRLMSLTKLKRLNVAKCEIDDEALRGISSLADLELLRVGSSRLTNVGLAEIAKLPKLRHLIIRFAPITDAGLKPLADLKGLESLYLEGTNVTEAGERELLRARPDLHIHFP